MELLGDAFLGDYDCRQCGVAMTEADDSQLASTAGALVNRVCSTTVLWSVLLTLSLIRKWINAIQR